MATDDLGRRFEVERPRLRAIAVRIVTSDEDADDVVQDAWLRLSRVDATTIDNLAAWLTTVVSRLSLNVLRSRTLRPTQPLSDAVTTELAGSAVDPEMQAIEGESVRIALLAVLDVLGPAERVAFVLHDVFELPFEIVAEILGRTVEATRQLASRARRRIGPVRAGTRADRARGHDVVDAFFAAGRRGDLQGLLDILHPGIELRVDVVAMQAPMRVRGARAVAERARSFADPRARLIAVELAGLAGAIVSRPGEDDRTMIFTVDGDRITTIDVQVGPWRPA